MKKLIFLLLISGQVLFAQQRDPRADQFNFVPGQIIVQLKEHIDAGITYKSSGVGSTQMDIGALLGISDKVSKTAVLFSEKTVLKSSAMKNSQVKDPRLPEPHSLKNTFVLELNDKEENIMGLVETLKVNPNVEYAEPNYYYSINNFTIESDIITEEEIKKSSKKRTFAAPNDPLYSQQTNITATSIDKVWEKYTTGDGSQIIAILDTGIDYEHPDLKANIWINTKELNGIEGFDDDGNGYIDDIHGWDFINIDNAPLDDNMHGTHVAGIAGAVGNNGIGVAGAAWNVKLMPIKVFQSNGVGNASTIALGVEYATNNGATIQNMSFGSYAESHTLRNALENAYATSVLVAAAGNDGRCIGPGSSCAPFYPAAYTYIMGVEDAAPYSNFDQDGPIFSGYSNLLNYEIYAPGTGILSTVPNGGYRTLTGTSMASPLLAGAIALYIQQKPDDSKELIFGNLINTAGSYVDILTAIEVIPMPELKVITAMTKDTISRQNGNGYLEPGETIEIFPLIKNYWGPTDDVRVGIEFAEFEDQSKATIVESEIAIGSITAYATLQDLTKSIKIKLADNVANNVNIKFNLKVWSGPDKDYLTSSEYVINVKNSILLFGVINYDLTLYPDKEYLVSDNLIISENAILNIRPGTTIKIADGKKINLFDQSRIEASGTKDSLIIFTNENSGWAGFGTQSSNPDPSIFDYVKINGVYIGQPAYLFSSSNYLIVSNLIVENSFVPYFINFNSTTTSQISKSNFYNNNVYVMSQGGSGGDNLNIIGSLRLGWNNGVYSGIYFSDNSFNYKELNIFNNVISFSVGSGGTTDPVFAYLGTSDSPKFRREVQDALTSSAHSGLFNINNISTIPHEQNHGIVWKVLINGKDAQDEYNLMDPVGVGTHLFDVYFNRAMDTNYPPQISYGVREPYTQKIIPETGTWSEDGKIYSVTHDVKIGAADGINRIRVQHARDLDYFDIPVEDSRFNMLVQSAGSASAGFMATPGLGKIALEWEVPEPELLEDVLGFNMYRYFAITDSTFSDTIRINTVLISDAEYVDYQVEEGKRYYYHYKILRTSFDETDFSRTVAAQPLTSKLGDCNGDFVVNVLDLVSSVDYILGNNPTPFIFKAADVNADTYINVLDIVGTVNIILQPSTKRIATANQEIQFYSNTPIGEALFYWEGDDLYVESKESIAGLQLAFEKDFNYTLSESLNKFEWLSYKQDNQKILMMYSFSGISITPGKTKLLTRASNTEAALDITKAAVGTPKGLKLTPIFKNGGELLDIDAPIQSDQAQLIIVAPNPSRGIFNIQYYIPEQMDKVLIQVYSLKGEQLWVEDKFKNTSGQANATLNLSFLNDGIYLIVMDVIRNGEIKKREVKKLVISKN